MKMGRRSFLGFLGALPFAAKAAAAESVVPRPCVVPNRLQNYVRSVAVESGGRNITLTPSAYANEMLRLVRESMVKVSRGEMRKPGEAWTGKVARYRP